MSPFLTMLGVVILVVMVLVVATVVGLPLAALGNLLAGLLEHPLGSPQTGRTGAHARPPIPLALRTAVLDRDGWQCVYCGSKDNLQIDHIIPVSKGGATVLGNLETLCESCNSEKGAK